MSTLNDLQPVTVSSCKSMVDRAKHISTGMKCMGDRNMPSTSIDLSSYWIRNSAIGRTADSDGKPQDGIGLKTVPHFPRAVIRRYPITVRALCVRIVASMCLGTAWVAQLPMVSAAAALASSLPFLVA